MRAPMIMKMLKTKDRLDNEFCTNLKAPLRGAFLLQIHIFFDIFKVFVEGGVVGNTF